MVNEASGEFNSLEPSAFEGLYLIRTHNQDAGPYDVLTDLSEADALTLAKELEPTRGAGVSDDLGNRDQSLYLLQRKEVDAWLKSSAIQMGINVERENPVHFALAKDPQPFIDAWINKNPNSSLAAAVEQRPFATVTIIPADQIDLSSWTFTGEDSFLASGILGPTDHPAGSQLMSAGDLLKSIEEHGFTDYGGEDRMPTYEAQMWSQEPLFLNARRDMDAGLIISGQSFSIPQA